VGKQAGRLMLWGYDQVGREKQTLEGAWECDWGQKGTGLVRFRSGQATMGVETTNRDKSIVCEEGVEPTT
jgi:hypothetical protein